LKIWIALAVVTAIIALGTAASLRYGVWGRRLTAGLVVLWVVAQMTPKLGERAFGVEPQAITCLRAINAAQLVYQTSLGEGRYARTLDELEKSWPSSDAQQGPIIRLSLRQSYRIELVSTGDSYAVTATPLPNPRSGLRGSRAFCVDVNGSIFQTLSGTRPAVELGRCLDRSKPIQ
jgi:hypothetical protein